MAYTDTELAELGIERTMARGRGQQATEAYVYKCAKCGRPVTRLCIILDRPVYCNLCKSDALSRKRLAAKAAEKNIEREAQELDKLMGLDPKCEARFSKAVDAVKRLGNFHAAIRAASAHVHKYGSTPEAIAAIMLISCGVQIIPQAKIFANKRSAVDFVLPDHKTVIEIDGELYHSDEMKQYLRDVSIRHRLGDEWKVLHIPAEALAKNPKAFRGAVIKRFCSNSTKSNIG